VGLNRNIPAKLEKSGLFSGKRGPVLEKVVAGEIVTFLWVMPEARRPAALGNVVAELRN
jgi:hypothetical protein